MQDLKTLIDKASEMCGGDKALALAMGIYRPDVSHLRSGSRLFSPELAAMAADLAGCDPRQAAIDAMVIRAKGTRNEDAMTRIFAPKSDKSAQKDWVNLYQSDKSVTRPQPVRINDGSLSQSLASHMQGNRIPAF